MNNLTTYCKDCVSNHTINCNNERKNSWYCPSYVKKLSEHEKHIMKIAKVLGKQYNCPIQEIISDYECRTGCLSHQTECISCIYDWMMSLKENKDD